MLLNDPKRLTDDELIGQVATLAGAAREATAALVGHLVELEARGLHLAQGFRSLYGYCRHVLHLSDHEAYTRMEAAHAALRFPVILPLLAEGRLHLTAVCLLAPRLLDENHLALLGGAFHKSKREVEELLARWFPRPAVPSSIRASRAVSPLAVDRYEVQFTVTGATIAKLKRAEELLSHAVPDGDVAEIFDRALDALLLQAARHKHAATDNPRPGRGTASASRVIPAAVEREVWSRDEGRCAFIGAGGRRCDARSLIEFHHLKPWSAGGPATVENIALRCRAHNGYEASRYFDPIRAAMDAHTRSGTSSVPERP